MQVINSPELFHRDAGHKVCSTASLVWLHYLVTQDNSLTLGSVLGRVLWTRRDGNLPSDTFDTRQIDLFYDGHIQSVPAKGNHNNTNNLWSFSLRLHYKVTDKARHWNYNDLTSQKPKETNSNTQHWNWAGKSVKMARGKTPKRGPCGEKHKM